MIDKEQDPVIPPEQDHPFTIAQLAYDNAQAAHERGEGTQAAVRWAGYALKCAQRHQFLPNPSRLNLSIRDRIGL
jgi:hypothetical protein